MKTNLKERTVIIFGRKLFLKTLILAVLMVVLCTVFLSSGAWLTAEGKWANSTYNLGRIEYRVLLNDVFLNPKDLPQTLEAVVPITGGVKINDSESVPVTAPNYEKFAEENFNEGVTLANICVENDSTFKVKFKYKLNFTDLFDGTTSQDLFYLILPNDCEVDSVAHTVKVGAAAPVSYKTYIKNILSANGGHANYAQMKTSLSSYYLANPTLKESGFELALPVYTDGVINDEAVFNINILFWSEYDELPFVTAGEYTPLVNDYQILKGKFGISIDIDQK